MTHFGTARIALGGLLLLALAVGACGDDDDGDDGTATASASATTATATAGASQTATTTPDNGSTPDATNTPGGDEDVPAAFDDGTDPLRALVSYYNAINRGEYARAYGYWRSPTQSETEFADGFAETATSIATLRPASGIDAAAGNRHMLIGAIITAARTDGSTQLFSGCYAMWRAAEGVSENPADNSWHIDEALIAPLGADAPLADACDPYADRVSMYDQAYDNRTGSVNVIASLYDAVNREQFERGYGYWETPEQSYDEFVSGYANTTSSIVTVGSPAHTEGAAGSVYEEVPAVIRSTLRSTLGDGTEQLFSGCYVLRRSNMPGSGGEDPSTNPWSIYSATIAAAPADADLAALLRDGCA